MFVHTCVGGTDVSLHWYEGRIVIAGADGEQTARSLVPIAAALDAHLLGDEDERYD
ncbi:MAG TPA: hypothetical protein VGG05_18955 [Pseudonocardiaceae bacterium]